MALKLDVNDKKWKSFDFSKLLFQGPAWNWHINPKTKPKNDQSGLKMPNCTTKKCVKRPLCFFLYGSDHREIKLVFDLMGQFQAGSWNKSLEKSKLSQFWLYSLVNLTWSAFVLEATSIKIWSL